MTTHDDNELAAIAAELAALGEPIPEEMAAELAEAELVSEVLASARLGREAVSELPDTPAPEGLDALHMLRGAAGADELGEFGRRRGLQRVREQLHHVEAQPVGSAPVIALWQRRSVQAFVAAAALVAFVIGALFLTPPGVQPPSAHVAAASQRAGELERQALRELMAGTATATPGDHGLRELRQARYELVAARAEARARRL